MSNIIWLVYLADISENIIQLFWAIAIFYPLITLLWGGSQLQKFEPEESEPYKLYHHKWVSRFKVSLIVSLIFLVFIFVAPSKNTIYTIVGLSAAQTVSQTPEAQKALKLINLGLGKAIDKLQESK